MNTPLLFLTLGGKLSVLPIEDDISAGSFIFGFYDLEVCSFYPYFLEGFYQERMLYFVKCFLCIYSEGHVVLVLSFSDVMNHIDCFADIEPALHPRYKSHLVVVNNFFNVLLDLIC